MRGTIPDGGKVRGARIACGLTQEQVAVLADLEAKTVRKAEQGKRLDVGTAAALAQTLQVELQELLARSDGQVSIEETRRVVVEQWLTAWETRDIESLMALYADESVMWLPGKPDIPFGGRHAGKAAIRTATELAWKVVQTSPAYRRDDYTLVSRDDTVIFVLHGAHAVSVVNGEQARMLAVHVYRFVGERIVDLQVEFDTVALRGTLGSDGGRTSSD